MTLPQIGVTAGRNRKTNRLELLEAYTRSIIDAGGIPLVIPLEISVEGLARLAGRLDGLMLSGGGDIDRARFSGTHHPRMISVDPLRDELEIALLQLAVEKGLPFLGICRGIQVINVALGGTLHTDIRDQLPGALRHDCFSPGYPRDHIAHGARIEPGSLLAQSMGVQQTRVNSMHHQGLARIAPGLTVSARAEDGLVEGVELASHPFGVGVQWHPECLPASPPDRALFRAFVTAAAQGPHGA